MIKLSNIRNKIYKDDQTQNKVWEECAPISWIEAKDQIIRKISMRQTKFTVWDYTRKHKRDNFRPINTKL
jgi:hypothetical protein